jgi:COP9 signalosome complex subunit 3
LHYSDNLSYHYTGGIALAALKRWAEAEEYFEICVTSPGTHPAALQLEALKKLRLVQLISGGKACSLQNSKRSKSANTFLQPAPLPKYTHPLLLRLFKNTPYQLFINAYPNNADQMREVYEKEKQTFNHVGFFFSFLFVLKDDSNMIV